MQKETYIVTIPIGNNSVSPEIFGKLMCMNRETFPDKEFIIIPKGCEIELIQKCEHCKTIEEINKSFASNGIFNLK